MTTALTTDRGEPLVWIDDLLCHAETMIVEFGRHEARLILPRLNRTDMSGTIRFVSRIDPLVRSIFVSSDDKAWVYERDDAGMWRCFNFKPEGEQP